MKDYLLDTHMLVWAFTEPSRLSPVVSRVLSSREAEVHVSVASVWELSIKRGLGKIQIPDKLIDEAEETIVRCGFKILPIRLAHVAAAGRLPPVHRDPFDRLLVAQAQYEHMVFVSGDAWVKQYPVQVVG